MSRRFLRGLFVARFGLDDAADAAVDVAGRREPLDGGHLRADFAGEVAGAGEGVEAADGPGVAAVELVDLAHQLGVGDDVVAARRRRSRFLTEA